MPDPRDDLIRRGDVLDAVFSAGCSASRRGDECLHPRCESIRESALLLTLTDIPADPVAAAALALLEKAAKALAPRWEIFWDPGRNDGGGCRVLRCQSCNSTYRSPSQEEHAPDCAWSAYRSAVAGREAGR